MSLLHKLAPSIASLATAAAFLISPLEVNADTNYVSKTGNHIYPYNTIENASTNISSAIDAASSGNTIQIDDGTYYENLLDPNGKDLLIKSNNGPTNTFLDGGNWSTILTVYNGEDVDINGFTFQNGRAMWTQLGNGDYGGGGAAKIIGSDVSFANCTFNSNTAEQSPESSLYSDGGAISATDKSIVHIDDCEFNNNTAIYHTGGAINSRDSTFYINNVTSSNNLAGGCYGGGFAAFWYNSIAKITNCKSKGDKARYYGQGGYGGWVRTLNADVSMSNCTVTACDTYMNGNPGKGGAVYISGGLPTVSEIVNCNFFGNSPDDVFTQTTDQYNIRDSYIQNSNANTIEDSNMTETDHKIESVEKSNNQMQVSFPTLPGRTYSIKRNTNLNDNEFQEIGQVIGDGSVMTYSDPMTNNISYYKVDIQFD